MEIPELVEKIKNKEIDVVDNIQQVLDKVKKINKKHHLLITLSEELALKQAEALKKKIKEGKARGSLTGIPVSIKDCLLVKGVESKAGSKILSGYLPVFNATAVQKIIEEGGIIIGKTTQDEFGFGSFCLNTGMGMEIPTNPLDEERVCGGSSGGSAGLTRALADQNIPHLSIAESTGGSIANPASFCGVVGLTPTYGLVSRYGLIDYANSLDKIGTMTSSVKEAFLGLEVIKGADVKDSTCLSQREQEKIRDLSKLAEIEGNNKGLKGMKIGLLKESLTKEIDERIRKTVETTREKMEAEGAEIKEVELPLTKKYGLAAYYLLATAEASTNLARLCGLRYGKQERLKGIFNEYFTKVRSRNFGEETKRRIILGTFARMSGFRDAYYIKAAQVRTKIIGEYKKVFSEVDALLSPTMPIKAPKIKEIEKLSPLQNYLMDALTVGPNLAGLPHISVPINEKNEGKKELPTGIMLIGNQKEEEKIIRPARALEKN